MNPGRNHIPIMPSNVRFWGKVDITLTGSDVCFEPKRPRSARDAAIGNAAFGTPAIQVSLPRHSPATAADARKEPQQRGGAVRVGKQGVTGITFLSISRYRSQGV